MSTWLKHRSAGVLLHIASLPGPHGIGDFGPAAHEFLDWLTAAGFRWWQVLPLNPTDPFYGSSPYRSISSYALSPLFVSPELLVADRLLDDDCLPGIAGRPDRRSVVNYPAVARSKALLLDAAWPGVAARFPGRLRRFCTDEADWLDDYALFVALKHRYAGTAWTTWPIELRDRESVALARVRGELVEEIRQVKAVQFILDLQWRRLRALCLKRGIGIIGDLPIYPDHDSADVWANRRYFKLDRTGQPRFVAGVPPDYFSKTGQLWGNPVYDWSALGHDGYRCWLDRIGRALRLYDAVRIDHFRGLAAAWQIPARARTAEDGRWARVPTEQLIAALKERFPEMPFIAEDLGHITPAVIRARKRSGLPGMKVAVFGFGDNRSPHRPDRVPSETVLYTSTHDTNTVRGWFEDEARPEERRRLAVWLKKPVSGRVVAEELVQHCLAGPARLAMIPVQDLLGLGTRARMNTPATSRGNWRWRLRSGQLTDCLASRVKVILTETGRLASH